MLKFMIKLLHQNHRDTDQTIRENFCNHQMRINDLIDQ